MLIKGKVHCLFEQSGTFKNCFKQLGYDAFDYDIKNDFNETDYQLDLFRQIENAFNNERERERESTIFDDITQDDLIMAFFPCIYFTGYSNPMYFNLQVHNYRGLTTIQKIGRTIERSKQREVFYEKLYMLCGVCMNRGLRLIIENPYTSQHYLHNNFIQAPSVIDTNRRARGDAFQKPTGYWFFNCEPTHNYTISKTHSKKTIAHIKEKQRTRARSMITSEYAHNFILDHILGEEINTNHKQQKELELQC